MSKLHRLLHLPHWQLAIIKRYPGIYTEPSSEVLSFYNDGSMQLPEHEDFCNLRYGFECDSGWAGLIEDLSATGDALVRVLRSFGVQNNARISAGIAKEKFGRFVWQGRDNLHEPFHRLWFAYARLIGERSKSTCERSGKFGKLRTIHGRFITLSDEEYQRAIRRPLKEL